MGLQDILNKIKGQTSKAADSAYTADTLPMYLKREYEKKGDKKLDKSIDEARQGVVGGAIEGLDKYQGIENPFTRRALAEKFQGSKAISYNSLTNEKTRRQGVVTDYINMWAGTYGAMAKAEQMKLEGMKDEFTMQMQLESHNKSMSGGGKKTSYTDIETRQMINEAKAAGKDWETIATVLGREGIDVNEGSVADDELRRLHGLSPVRKTASSSKEMTEKQQYTEKYYNLLNEIGSGNSEYQIDAKGNIVKSGKDKGWFWGDLDDEIVHKKP
jgi:hypothetical protein